MEIKRYSLTGVKLKRQENVMYSIGNIVNNTLIILYGDRWYLDFVL